VQLDHQIERYSAADGTVAIWVRIPSLSHTADTVIYLWYGNSQITTSQEHVAGVWMQGFGAILHLGEPSGAPLLTDALGVSGATPTGTSAAGGQIGGATRFNGTSDSASVPDAPSFTPGANGFTVSGWFNLTALPPATTGNRMW